MRWHGVWRTRAWAAWTIALLGLTQQACTSDSVSPNPSVQDLVGDWEATALVLTSVANPAVSADLIAQGGTFTLNIQPSGHYTAILISGGAGGAELGVLSVSGSAISLRTTYPPPPDTATGTFSLSGNTLTIDAETDYEFLNGLKELAQEHVELVKK